VSIAVLWNLGARYWSENPPPEVMSLPLSDWQDISGWSNSGPCNSHGDDYGDDNGEKQSNKIGIIAVNVWSELFSKSQVEWKCKKSSTKVKYRLQQN
jgi:hypothetical protein